MKEPRDSSPSADYPRPQQAWQCGLSDEGPPCALGPSVWGRCPAAAACHPVRDGERWLCNRSDLRGGPCHDGPGPDGQCSVVLRCSPVRSLRKRRGRFVMGCFLAAIGALCMGLSSSWRHELIVPGPLSSHHAQIFTGAESSTRCARCHSPHDSALAGLLGFGADSGPAPSQSELCMACHEKSFARSFAQHAHNMPMQILLGSEAIGNAAAVPRLRDPADPIACSACHREHQGREHDLTAITDAACQACHRDQFPSFADGHPDFGAWPYDRPTHIAFDHASHQSKHHPAANKSFECTACHEPNATGNRQLTKSYSASCAECHDKALMLSLQGGVPFIALPTLDVEALKAAGHDIGPWPQAARGDFDGRLPWITALLLGNNFEAQEGFALLTPTFNFFDVDPKNADQMAATAKIAGALRALVNRLAAEGLTAIDMTLSASILGKWPMGVNGDDLTSGLTAELLHRYRDHVFGTSATASPEPVNGVWRIDDATLSLRRKTSGHADPWLRAWYDALAEAASTGYSSDREALLRAALKPTAPGQCGACHRVERDVLGHFSIQWRASDKDDRSPRLTHFGHAAHVLQADLRNCTACHQIASPAVGFGVATSGANPAPHADASGFAALGKSACITCHTAGTAGNACTQCHKYHDVTSAGLRFSDGTTYPESALFGTPGYMPQPIH